jgi:ParB family chromosome partitioning protein
MEKQKQKKAKKGLGRGLGSLLGEPVSVEPEAQETKPVVKEKVIAPRIEPEIVETKTEKTDQSVKKVEKQKEEAVTTQYTDDGRKIFYLPIEKVEPHADQPRTHFDKEKLTELAESIKQKGVVQPILVRPIDKSKNKFQIVAGERRWRASQQAGLHHVPAIIKDYSDLEVLEIALVENIQRHDLNSIEEAKAYQQLIDLNGWTQDELAKKISKDRTTISNYLRLLNLHPTVQNMIVDKKISMGHAKAILAVADHPSQIQLAKKVVDQKLSVRATEKEVQQSPKSPSEMVSVESLEQKLVKRLETDLQRITSRKVQIKSKNSKGKLMISFYSIDELNQLSEVIKRGWKNN